MVYIRYPTRVKLGIVFIVFVILTSSLRQLTSALSAFRASGQTDDISQYERRFTEVKRFLPPDQIVSYSDEFARFSKQCDAFVLAQYSVAPTVLAVTDSQCGQMRRGGEVSSHWSRLVLENVHDPLREAYLLLLFPNTYFEPHNDSPSFTGGELSHADKVVLVQDFGLGLRLYAKGDK